MNAIYFCNMVRAYKERKEELELTHGISSWKDKIDNKLKTANSNYGTYYKKIDNYYGPGKPRYFTKFQWDAHEKYLKRLENKAKREVEEENKRKQDTVPKSMRGYQETVNQSINGQPVKSLVYEAQKGREAAIRNSSQLTNEEKREVIERAREYDQQERLNAALKPVRDAFGLTKKAAETKVFEFQKGRENAIKNSLTADQARENLKDAELSAKTFGVHGAMKRLQNKQKKVEAYANEHKAELEAELTKTKQEKLDQLNENYQDIEHYLRRRANGKDVSRSETKEIMNNPLYQALNLAMKENDEDFTNIIDYLDTKTEKHANEIKEVLREISKKIEEEIDEPTILTLANEKVKA